MYLAQYYMHVYVNPVLFHLARATASDPCLGVRVGAAYIFDLHTGFQIFLIVEFFFMVTRCPRARDRSASWSRAHGALS